MFFLFLTQHIKTGYILRFSKFRTNASRTLISGIIWFFYSIKFFQCGGVKLNATGPENQSYFFFWPNWIVSFVILCYRLIRIVILTNVESTLGLKGEEVWWFCLIFILELFPFLPDRGVYARAGTVEPSRWGSFRQSFLFTITDQTYFWGLGPNYPRLMVNITLLWISIIWLCFIRNCLYLYLQSVNYYRI
jgi:hypothetical protein